MFQREVSVFDVDVDVGMNNDNVGDGQQQQQQRFLQEMTFRRNCSVCHFNTGKIEGHRQLSLKIHKIEFFLC